MIGLTVAAAALAAGCTRDPAPALCPDLAVGELIVTEFRGPQTDETEKAWVELYNASGASVDLEGTKIRFRRKDGSSEVPVLVRRSLTVAANGYTVLGLVNDDEGKPSFIDYGFASDFHVGFLSAAAVDVEACGVRIDRAVYDVLPKTGTYSFGTTPPDADSNDIPVMWCVNAGAETNCTDTVDNDSDGSVNDGCPQVGAAAETVCSDTIDNDSDGVVNDGCLAAAETKGTPQLANPQCPPP